MATFTHGDVSIEVIEVDEDGFMQESEL